MSRITAAQRVHDSPELLSLILQYVFDAREYYEKGGDSETLPLVSRNVLAQVVQSQSKCEELGPFFRWRRDTRSAEWSQPTMIAHCDAVKTIQIRDKDRELEGFIKSQSRSKGQPPVSRSLLDSIKTICPNVEHVHTIIPPVNRERSAKMDDFIATFKTSGRPHALWIHNIRVNPQDRVRKDWSTKTVAWRGWDIDQAVHLIMSVDAKHRRQARTKLLEWFESAPRWSVPVIALHTEGFTLSLEDIEKIIQQSASTPRSAAMEDSQITSLRVTVDSITLEGLKKLFRACGRELEILDLLPDPTCKPKAGSNPLNLTQLPELVDLIDELCPNLGTLGLPFHTTVPHTDDNLKDSHILHPTPRNFARRIQVLRLYTWTVPRDPNDVQSWSHGKVSYLTRSNAGWSDQMRVQSEYAHSDSGLLDYRDAYRDLDRHSDGGYSARFDANYEYRPYGDLPPIPLLSVARNLINLCTRRARIDIIHIEPEYQSWEAWTSTGVSMELRKIMLFFRDQPTRTREHIRTLDFDTLELTAAWRIIDGRPLPDGTLPLKPVRDAMAALEKGRVYANRMIKKAERIVERGKKRQEEARETVKILEAAGVPFEPVDWPEISIQSAQHMKDGPGAGRVEVSK